jgi:hypothetical protein
MKSHAPWSFEKFRRYRAYTFALLGALLIVALDYKSGKAEDDSSERFAYEIDVDYCQRTETKPMALSDDKRILCLDGWITPDLDISLVEGLEKAGWPLYRSKLRWGRRKSNSAG